MSGIQPVMRNPRSTVLLKSLASGNIRLVITQLTTHGGCCLQLIASVVGSFPSDSVFSTLLPRRFPL